MKRSVIETIIGFFVLLVTAIFFVFSYKVADVQKLDSTYELIAKFNQVEGIVVGSDVAISGIKVGTVKGLGLDNKDYSAKMVLAIKNTVKLPSDSSAKIVSEGLLGGKYVSIEAGADEEMLEDGDQIMFTQSSMNLENLIGKFAFGSPDDGKKAKSKNSFLLSILILFVSTLTEAAQLRGDLHKSMSSKSNYYPYAVFQGLDRVSDNKIEFRAQVGKGKNYFENLMFTVSKCWKAESSVANESAAFVTVYEKGNAGQKREVYSGWLFSNNAYLTNIEHSQYNLRLLSCKRG